MPLKTEPLEEPQLILTPVIDIMFLLLIFFMVGTQFVDDERYFDIKLPMVSEALSVTSLPDPATVNVAADGTVVLDGDAVPLTDLEGRLVAMRENYPGQAVVIRGDGATALNPRGSDRSPRRMLAPPCPPEEPGNGPSWASPDR